MLVQFKVRFPEKLNENARRVLSDLLPDKTSIVDDDCAEVMELKPWVPAGRVVNIATKEREEFVASSNNLTSSGSQVQNY